MSLPAEMAAVVASAIFFTSSGMFVNGARLTMWAPMPPQVSFDFQLPSRAALVRSM